MDNKEAIRILKLEKDSIDMEWLGEEGELLQQAYDLAIKSLEERQQGRWIKHDTWDYSCSICGETFTVDDGIVEDLPNFCPDCGAKMKGGAEDAK